MSAYILMLAIGVKSSKTVITGSKILQRIRAKQYGKEINKAKKMEHGSSYVCNHLDDVHGDFFYNPAVPYLPNPSMIMFSNGLRLMLVLLT